MPDVHPRALMASKSETQNGTETRTENETAASRRPGGAPHGVSKRWPRRKPIEHARDTADRFDHALLVPDTYKPGSPSRLRVLYEEDQGLAVLSDDRVSSELASAVAFESVGIGELTHLEAVWLHRTLGALLGRWKEDDVTSPNPPVPVETRVNLSVVRPIEERKLRCVMCEAPIVVDDLNSPHPEAPEMMRLPSDVWFGFTRTDEQTTEVIVTCGQDCTQRLLLEGGESEDEIEDEEAGQ